MMTDQRFDNLTERLDMCTGSEHLLDEFDGLYEGALTAVLADKLSAEDEEEKEICKLRLQQLSVIVHKQTDYVLRLYLSRQAEDANERRNN